MISFAETPAGLSRRAALQLGACGFGYLAFAGLQGLQAQAAEAVAGPLSPKKSPLPAKAKHVIFLCMQGGPSHVDTFDHKPELTKDNGKAPPSGKGRGFGCVRGMGGASVGCGSSTSGSKTSSSLSPASRRMN